MPDASGIKAIVFDTFGTVVDWRGSIVPDLGRWGDGRGLSVDWADVADRWRGRYRSQMARVRSGELPWTNLDELHREALGTVFDELGVPALGDEDMLYVNRVWHRLEGWPDARVGLRRIKDRFIIGPLSNANVAILVNMAKGAGLPRDVIFSSELFRHYKPDLETYRGVCQMLYLEPEAVMMCAAHNFDLAAARKVGLRTAFISRLTEYGPGQTTDLSPEQDWDFVAAEISDLADQLGCWSIGRSGIRSPGPTRQKEEEIAMRETKSPTEPVGFRRGLTNYGDRDFSAYLRRSFASSTGAPASLRVEQRSHAGVGTERLARDVAVASRRWWEFRFGVLRAGEASSCQAARSRASGSRG